MQSNLLSRQVFFKNLQAIFVLSRHPCRLAFLRYIKFLSRRFVCFGLPSVAAGVPLCLASHAFRAATLQNPLKKQKRHSGMCSHFAVPFSKFYQNRRFFAIFTSSQEFRFSGFQLRTVHVHAAAFFASSMISRIIIKNLSFISEVPMLTRFISTGAPIKTFCSASFA